MEYRHCHVPGPLYLVGTSRVIRYVCAFHSLFVRELSTKPFFTNNLLQFSPKKVSTTNTQPQALSPYVAKMFTQMRFLERAVRKTERRYVWVWSKV